MQSNDTTISPQQHVGSTAELSRAEPDRNEMAQHQSLQRRTYCSCIHCELAWARLWNDEVQQPNLQIDGP